MLVVQKCVFQILSAPFVFIDIDILVCVFTHFCSCLSKYKEVQITINIIRETQL